MYKKVCDWVNDQERRQLIVQEKAKELGKDLSSVPKFYLPKIDDSSDQIEKQNKRSIEIYSK